MKLKVKCPAKINLSLKVFKKDETTGFHPIKSIMQSVSLYDFITVEKTVSGLEFSGNSKEITYDNNNLILKAADLFFEKAKIKTGLKIYLEKNIPVAAGLAGGSTDAAGILLLLNEMFNKPLSEIEIYSINAKSGSDLNFCYKGGRALCEGKGDDITPLPYEKFKVTIVKPKTLKISTKTAYEAFDNLIETSNLENDLEFALLPKYKELQTLHNMGFQMSGSGPSFFIKEEKSPIKLSKQEYDIFENLASIPNGVSLV